MAAEEPKKVGNADRTEVFTLPVSCQICLGTVRQPSLCSNLHVFCASCIQIWLQKSHQCPVCRIAIDRTNPVQRIRGGQNQTEEAESTPELRKTRFDLLYKEYEESLEKLQHEVKVLKTENSILQSQLSAKTGTQTSSDAGSSVSNSQDNERLHLLTKKLQDAQKLYDRVKQDISKLKQENTTLKEKNFDLVHENSRLREEVSSRSPMKYGRLTVATLESQLEARSKEVQHLTKALERSDQYIEQLQQQLQKSQNLAATSHDDASDQLQPARKFQAESSLFLQNYHRNEVQEKASDQNHSVKRQLFTSEPLKPQATLSDQQNVGNSHNRPLFPKQSEIPGLDLKPTTKLPESNLKKTEDFFQLDSIDREKIPTKKVQFNLQEKKTADSSSFDLEVPSPLVASYIGKLSLESGVPSASSRGKRTDTEGEKLPSTSITAALAKKPGHALPNHIPQKWNVHAWNTNQSSETDDLSHLSEPSSALQSLSDSEKKAPLSKVTTAELSDECFRRPKDNRKDRFSGQTRNSSFHLEGPGLDDTQSIQTELNDLDISVTPELSDCLKLLNRAEKKIHNPESPVFSMQAGTKQDKGDLILGESIPGKLSKSSVPIGRVDFGRDSHHGSSSWSCRPGPGSVTMRGWEHNFFSSLRVNPYRHSSALPNMLSQNPTEDIPTTFTSLEHDSTRQTAFSSEDMYKLTSLKHAGEPWGPRSLPSVESGCISSLLPQTVSVPTSFSHSHNGLKSSMSSLPLSCTTSVSATSNGRSMYTDDQYGHGSSVSLGVAFNGGRDCQYEDIRRKMGSCQNYSYVSNASYAGGDMAESKNSDSLLPEPKKRLFDFESEDEIEFSSPQKTTKML